MRVYNLVGYALLILHATLAVWFAPPVLGPWWGLIVGVLYLLFVWFLAGVYLSDVIHMGIAHGALDYKEWFVKGMTLLNNTVGIYVNPVTWVNRHRHHHMYSDHAGDPNKLHGDGFWKTMYLCLFPYPCEANLASDPILRSWPFRLVANPAFAIVSQCVSYGLILALVQNWIFALALWCGVRLFALWVNMVQNYWTHDRRFGTRRYGDPGDNAMNVGDWLPVTATFSACWQNNHHHYPHFLRLSHERSEYDFGFLTVRFLKALGLVKGSSTGMNMPKDVPLDGVGL